MLDADMVRVFYSQAKTHSCLCRQMAFITKTEARTCKEGQEDIVREPQSSGGANCGCKCLEADGSSCSPSLRQPWVLLIVVCWYRFLRSRCVVSRMCPVVIHYSSSLILEVANHYRSCVKATLEYEYESKV